MVIGRERKRLENCTKTSFALNFVLERRLLYDPIPACTVFILHDIYIRVTQYELKGDV